MTTQQPLLTLHFSIKSDSLPNPLPFFLSRIELRRILRNHVTRWQVTDALNILDESYRFYNKKKCRGGYYTLSIDSGYLIVSLCHSDGFLVKKSSVRIFLT